MCKFDPDYVSAARRGALILRRLRLLGPPQGFQQGSEGGSIFLYGNVGEFCRPRGFRGVWGPGSVSIYPAVPIPNLSPAPSTSEPHLCPWRLGRAGIQCYLWFSLCTIKGAIFFFKHIVPHPQCFARDHESLCADSRGGPGLPRLL